MKIVTLTKLNSGCDYHRITIPFRFMKMQDGDRIVNYNDDDIVRFSDFKGVDVVVFNRLPHLKIDVLLQLKQKYGFKMVMDLDDYWRLYPEHPLYSVWNKNRYAEKLIHLMGEVDEVWATTFKLAGKVLKMRETCDVVENGIPFGIEQFTPKKKTSSNIFTNFIYAGGNSHLEDLKSVKDLFKLLPNSDFRRHGRVILAGYDAKHGRDGVWWKMKKIIDECKCTTTLPTLPLRNYMECYDEADVSIAPLAKNEFNECKSNLKVIEAGCKGIPIIASRIYPYEIDSSIDDNGVFLCSTIKEWKDAFEQLLNKEERQKQGAYLQKYVMKHYNLDKINNDRIRSLQNIIK